jgi:hypothetical protein
VAVPDEGVRRDLHPLGVPDTSSPVPGLRERMGIWRYGLDSYRHKACHE